MAWIVTETVKRDRWSTHEWLESLKEINGQSLSVHLAFAWMMNTPGPTNKWLSCYSRSMLNFAFELLLIQLHIRKQKHEELSIFNSERCPNMFQDLELNRMSGLQSKVLQNCKYSVTYRLDTTKMHNFWDPLKKMDDFRNLPEGA